VAKAAVTTQMEKTTTAPTEETKEGREISMEHDIQGGGRDRRMHKPYNKIEPTQEAACPGEANCMEKDKGNEYL